MGRDGILQTRKGKAITGLEGRHFGNSIHRQAMGRMGRDTGVHVISAKIWIGDLWVAWARALSKQDERSEMHHVLTMSLSC